MKVINFTEFRKNASGILSEVEMGETVQILRHGKPIAQIAPASSSSRIPSWKKPGLRLQIENGALSEAIIEERKEAQ
jgi:antitoxin (DNA-binding transcriptional repressor) of toxin-antitoxin stability system